MHGYVDGFVQPLAPERAEEYRPMAEKAARIWKEHGALAYRECVLDDGNAMDMRTFPELTGAVEGETVIFAWTVFASREEGDAANAWIMADPRLGHLCGPDGAPFACTRMAYGGFRSLVRA